MYYKIEDIEVGDRVTIRSAVGSGPLQVGTVDDVFEGTTSEGIYYKLDDGNRHWAYIDQVTHVRRN